MNGLSLHAFANALDRYSCPLADRSILRRATWPERIKFYFYPKTRVAKEKAILKLAIASLKSAPRVTPKQAFKGREVYILREWLGRSASMGSFKLLPQEEQLADVQFKTLRKFKMELTAYRLGITSANLRASEGLEKFTENKAYLPNYLSHYNHTLKCESSNSPIRILMNDQYVDWEAAKAEVVVKEDVPGIPVAGPSLPSKWPWKYGRTGLHNRDLFVKDINDVEERAYHKEKYKNLGKWLFSYCIFHADNGPRFSGDHSWIRLTDPTGKIYEFGKYRPPDIKGRTTALQKHTAILQSPDCSTMWPTPPKEKHRGNNPPLRHTDRTKRSKIHFEINETLFNNALEKVRSIHAQGKLTFGLFDQSCAVFANEIAAVCGIKLNTSASVAKLLLPAKLIPVVDKVVQYIPEPIFTLLYFTPGVLTNIFCLFLGAAHASDVDGSRHIGSPLAFFNPYKSTLHHPWYVATQVKAAVEKGRLAGSYAIPAAFQVAPVS